MKLDNIGIETDNEIIIKRILDEYGKSKSLINDTPISLKHTKRCYRRRN